MTPAQCRMARAAIELGVRELADAAQVSTNTITRFERGEDLKLRTVEAIQRALEAAGVQFIPENGGGAGVRLATASSPSQKNEDGASRDADARDMATHQVNKALKGVAASPSEKAARREQLTKLPQRPAEPIDEGKRPEDLNAENDD